MPFNFPQEQQGALQAVLRGVGKQSSVFWERRRGGGGELEDVLLLSTELRSVLDRRRSASPRTSTSTLSSSLGGGDISSVAADKSISASEEARKEEWSEELPPILADLGSGRAGGVEDWESVLSGPGGVHNGQDQSFYGWVMGGADDEFKSHQLMPQDLGFGLEGDFGAAGFVPIFVPIFVRLV